MIKNLNLGILPAWPLQRQYWPWLLNEASRRAGLHINDNYKHIIDLRLCGHSPILFHPRFEN
jgi:hypothetical protein